MTAAQTMSQMTARNTRLVIMIRPLSGGEAEPRADSRIEPSAPMCHP